MTTNNRMSRFNNADVLSIENMGYIDNSYLRDNGVIRSDISSTDALKSLTSFLVKTPRFSNQKIRELFDYEFSEFVEKVESDVEENILIKNQISFLESRLNQLTNENNELEEIQSISSAQKQIIIELRILLGQGRSAEDFSPDFPYNSLIPQPATVTSTVEPISMVDVSTENGTSRNQLVTDNTIILPNEFGVSLDISYDQNNNIINSSDDISPRDSIIRIQL